MKSHRTLAALLACTLLSSVALAQNGFSAGGATASDTEPTPMTAVAADSGDHSGHNHPAHDLSAVTQLAAGQVITADNGLRSGVQVPVRALTQPAAYEGFAPSRALKDVPARTAIPSRTAVRATDARRTLASPAVRNPVTTQPALSNSRLSNPSLGNPVFNNRPANRGYNNSNVAPQRGRGLERGRERVARTGIASGVRAMPVATTTENFRRLSLEQAKLNLIEAHELSSKASTESQYTRVIELCKAAGTATQLPPEIVTYAQRSAAWAYNRRGELRADAGLSADALADFDKAVQNDNACWRAVHNRAVSYAQEGELKRAFDDFSQTIALQPKHAKAYSNRAALYEQAEDFHSALKDYRAAITLEPELAIAHAGRARVSRRMQSYDVARDELNEAIRLDPENALFYSARADLFAEMGYYEEALNDYSRAVQKNGALAEAYSNGAWLFATCPDARFRNPAQAVKGAKKALEIGAGERHIILDTLAAAYASAGDFNNAVLSAKAAIDEAPEANKPNYTSRLKLYQQGQPFVMQPVQR